MGDGQTQNKQQLHTLSLPTEIIPTKVALVKLSGQFPMGVGIPPLLTMLE